MDNEWSSERSEERSKEPLPRTLTEEVLAFMRTERWIMLALLLGVTGATVYLLIQLSKRMNTPINGLNGLNGYGQIPNYFPTPPLQIINQLPPYPQFPTQSFAQLPFPVTNVASTKSLPAADDYASPVSYSTRLFTVELSATQPTRLFQAAGGKFWRIQMRNIGPPGSFALISTDSSQLQNTGVSNNEVIILPAGGFNDFQLRPDQAIFGRGNVTSVSLSISAFVER